MEERDNLHMLRINKRRREPAKCKDVDDGREVEKEATFQGRKLRIAAEP